MYIICSYGRSGTNLFDKIMKTIADKLNLFSFYNYAMITLLRNVNQSTLLLSKDILWVGGNFVISRGGTLRYRCIYKCLKENKYKRFEILIPKEISEKYPEVFEFTLHSLPEGLAKWDVKNLYKKYYIVRNVRDALDSQMHFINNAIYNTEVEMKKKSLVDVREEVANSLYKDKKIFMDLLGHWIKHVSSYIRNQNSFILVKLEDILANPIDFIINRANDFGVVIERSIAEEIWLQAGEIPVNSYGESLIRASPKHWKNHFEKEHYDIFNASKAPQLMRKLGYLEIDEDDEHHSQN